MILRGLALMLGTRRGLAVFTGSALVTFGLLAGLIQLYAALWPKRGVNQALTVVLVVLVIVAVATFRAWPRRVLQREFDLPDITVEVKVGDLFDQAGNLVVGFSDTFDTDTADGTVISPDSVQGQFLHRVYAGDLARLNDEIERALDGVGTVSEELPSDKVGKRRRYPIGTVATLGPPSQRYFCVAYTYLQNDLVARSNVDHIWEGLSRVWDAARRFGQQRTLVIPVVGSELARISSLDRESLLKMVLLSFVARSRQEYVSKKLLVVVHPKDYEKIDMLEVKAFLATL